MFGFSHHTWRWVVLLAATFINFSVDGYNFAFGLVKIELEKDYLDIEKQWIALIGALVPGLYCLFSPPTEALAATIGMRTTVIIATVLQLSGFIVAFCNQFLGNFYLLDLLGLGFLQGIGSALLYGTSIADISKQFKTHNAWATGITMAGSPLGAIFYGSTFKFFMHAIPPFGWRGALIIFAAIASLNFLCGFVFTLPPMQHNTHPSPPIVVVKEKKSYCTMLRDQFDSKLLCNASFLFLLAMTSFFITGYYIPPLLISGQARQPAYNVSVTLSNNLLTIWGASNVVGRIALGRLADLHTKMFCSYTIITTSTFACAALLFVFPHIMAYGDVAFGCFVVIYGVLVAPGISMRPVILKELFGPSKVGPAFAYMLLSDFVFVVIGFCVSTYVNTIAALWAYTFGGACFAIAGLFMFGILRHYFSRHAALIAEIRQNQQVSAVNTEQPEVPLLSVENRKQNITSTDDAYTNVTAC